MKKYFSAFILCILILLLALSACDSTDVPTQTGTDSIQDTGSDPSYDNISGDYIYRRANTSDDKILLLKYNVHTGEVDTVCNDPFCTHTDDNCPFWSPADTPDRNIVSVGNTVYFSKESSDGKYNICAYSPGDISLSYVYTSNNILSSPFAYGQYLFFSETQDTSARLHTILKMDVKTGETKCLREDTSDNIYKISEGRIIWNTSKGYESTNLDGKNAKSFNITEHSGYIYKTEWISGSSWRDIVLDEYRRKSDSDEWELIASGIGPATFVNDKILYFKPLPVDEQKVLYSDSYGTYYDYFGGCVYIMNPDGTDNRLLCRASGANIRGMSSSRANELICGDYVGIYIYSDSTEQYESDGIMATTDLLIVNIVTGEYVVSRYGN